MLLHALSMYKGMHRICGVDIESTKVDIRNRLFFSDMISEKTILKRIKIQ